MFLTEEVTYMDHTQTNIGLKPDEEKMRVITEFPAPHDLHHQKCFIGMVKYFSKFDHLLTTKCETFNRLTWKDQVFQWAVVQQRAFKDIKKAIANMSVLTYFDLLICTDMSDVGVQNRKPVSYVSSVWNN